MKVNLHESIGVITKVGDDYIIDFGEGKRKIKVVDSLIDIMSKDWFDNNIGKRKWFIWRIYDYFDDTDNGYRVVAHLNRDIE